MWLKPGGYTIINGPHGVKEMDSFTCGHCQWVTFVDARTSPEDLGGRCTCCDKLICKHCVGKGCRPIERWLEQMESRRHIEALMHPRDW